MRQPKLAALLVLIFTVAATAAVAAPGAFTLDASADCNGTSPRISLTWTASSGATSYSVFRNNVSIATLSSQTTAYTDTQPISGSFTYFIRASDGSATTDSNSQLVSVPNCLPAPGSFTLSGNEFCNTATRQSAVHLSWTASSNASTYDVYENNVRIIQGLLSSQRSVDLTSSSYVAGANPSFYVVAVNNTSSTSSNTVNVAITGNACPPLPSAPSLSGSAACDTSTNPSHAIVNLAWTASTNATGYQIFRNNTAYASPTGTTFTDQNVSVGQSYTYFVRATNSGGSANSNTISVDVASNICGTPPGAFTLSGSAACNSGAGGVHLSWTASGSATGYNVFRNNAKIAGPIASTSYDDTTGLTTAIPYSYRVDAINSAGTTQSNTVDVTLSGPECQAPGGFVVNAVTPFCTSGASPAPALRVTWSQASNATSYIVNRNGAPLSGTLSAGTTSYDDTNVTPGQTYSYTVTARNNFGSTVSTGANGTAGIGCAALPGAFSASASAFCTAGNSSSPAVHVTWTASSNASSYAVYRNGSPLSGALPAVSSSFDDTSVSGGQTYSYSVLATNSAGNTMSSSASATTSSNCAPPAPSSPSLSASTICSGSPAGPVVRLTWTAASGATNYMVYRNNNAISGLLPSSTLTFDDANVSTGQSYSYSIRASNASGSTDSNLLSVSIPAGTCVLPPGDFTLNGTAFCDRNGTPSPAVRLTWTPSSGVTSYSIVRNGAVIATEPSSSQSYRDTSNVSTGTTYTYVVRATGAGGTTNSNTVSVTPPSTICTTQSGAPDLVPSNLAVNRTNVLPGESVTLSFVVANDGDGIASATTTRVRFGTTLATATAVASIATPSLNPGASVTLTETVAIPAVAPNTYFFFVTVDDDHILAQSNTSNDTLQSDPIRVRTSCTTECAATVVATAAAGNIVGFTLTNAPSCAGASVVWNFGDGVTAVGDTTSHTYSAAGTYTWSVTVTASGAGSCQSSGTITIVGSGAPKRRRAVGH